MLIFKRSIEERILERLSKGRAILIFGPRQAGKTTLAKKLVASLGEAGGYFNCELAEVRNNFQLGRPELIKSLIGDKTTVVFDEAQTVQDIGKVLKVFIDTYPEVQIIATGSSSFDLANKINEPLTGRAFEFVLYPLSFEEIQQSDASLSSKDVLELLRLGTYPAVVAENSPRTKEDLLKNIATNYLYKDIYTFESIRNPRIFEQLVQLLAHQTGSLVSVNELAIALGISRATVEKYLRLLEQSYVIKVVRSFSRNPRNEIKKAFKVYFIDTGLRNAVINDVSEVDGRQDKGALFENFFIMERFKKLSLHTFAPRILFWRDRAGHEIDIVEEGEGVLRAYECKWDARNHDTTGFRVFKERYPHTETKVISRDDFR